jgi:hypothetical protein
VDPLGGSENATEQRAFSSQADSLGDSENAAKQSSFSGQVTSLGLKIF